MIVPFEDMGAADTTRVGGKGANLGECFRAGLPVPPGFCVSTDAYRDATHEIADHVRADAARGNAVAARNRVLGLPLPPSLSSAIADAYDRLGAPTVAVRSSATAEDLPEASFAGQQDTYLGIVGIDAVLDAVRRCWASLWTDRAVDYRRQHDVPDNDLAVAVVVQTMVAADTAGVLFTRNPVTGEQTTMLASAAYGLGESVVAALVTPDTFVLSRTPPAVVDRQLGSKQSRIDVATAGGTVSMEVSEADRAMQSVSDEQLLRLTELGERVEAHYGTGQDIEWAFVGQDLYLLQARPITTHTTAVPGHTPVNSRVERTLRDDLIEHYPAPFPLDLFAVHQIQGAIQDLMRTAGLRAAPAASLLHGNEDGVIRIDIAPPRPGPAVLTRLPRLFVQGIQHDPARWPGEEAALREQLEFLAGRIRELHTNDDDTVLAVLGDAVARAASITADRFISYLAPMIVNRTLAAGLIKLSRSKCPTSPEDLYVGVPYKTAEISAAIAELAELARGCGAADVITSAPPGTVGQALASLPAEGEFREPVGAFLAEHGARTARMYLPFSNRSWREDPEAFYALLAATLRGTPLPQDPRVNPAQQIEERLPALLRRRWRSNTAKLQARHIGREGTVYLIEEFFCIARAAMDTIASRLVDRRQLDDTDDVRYLYLPEVEGALDNTKRRLQPIVARRRRRRGAAEAIWWDRDQPADDSALRGLPASAGRATGTARVIHSPAEFHSLQPGDVLVCPFTDPAWTPLFALAVAVVADTGGPLSHAAIVAREYGIPAVLGVAHATSLPDGATLLVDGTSGAVTVLD